MHTVNIGDGDPDRLTIISGPCVIESEAHLLDCAARLKEICEAAAVNLIFKASYDKANRSAGSSFRGVGLQEGLRLLARVQKEFQLPVTTDVHTEEEAKRAGEVVDLIQIPAFLSRQTDLILAAGNYARAVSVKKGQFMAPWDMRQVVDKLESTGQKQIILIDRGTSFGYNNLVSDMRAIPIMQAMGYPVCFDATHSVQLPGSLGGSSGGQREFVPTLAKAALAAGADLLFLEAHPDPDKAMSDAATQISFAALPALLAQFVRVYQAVRTA